MIQIMHKSGVRFDAPLLSGARCVCKIMEEDYIEIPFSTVKSVHFEIGDYVDLAESIYDGIGLPPSIRKKYVITGKQVPAYNVNTGGYDWRLRLDAYYLAWNNRVFKFRPERFAQEASWGLTDKIEKFLDIYTANLSAYGFGEFGYSIDEELKKYNINLSFQGTKMIDALKMICDKVAEEYNVECEWWVYGTRIYIGKCENQMVIPLSLSNEGESISIDSITPEDSDQEYANRLVVFGGTQNLSARYRKNLYFHATKVSDDDEGVIVVDEEKTNLSVNWFKFSEREYRESTKFIVKTDTSGFIIEDYVGRNDFINGRDAGLTKEIGRFVPVNSTQNFSYDIQATISVRKYYYVKDGHPFVDSAGEYFGLNNIYAVLRLHRDGVEDIVLERQERTVGRTETAYVTFNNAQTKVSEDFMSGEWKIMIDFTLRTSEELPSSGSATDTGIFALFNTDAEVVISQSGAFRINTTVDINGTVYQATVNPEYSDTFDERSKNILIKGITDIEDNAEFTFPDIVRGKVDAGYFVSENDDVVNGIVQTNLMLPKEIGTNYIDVFDDLSEEQIVEKLVIFDNVYPKQDFKCGNVDYYTSKTEEEDASGIDVGIKEGVLTRTHYHYQFKIDDLEFSDECLIEGVSLGVHFETGSLAGLDFAVAWKPTNDAIGDDDDAHRWEIINNTNYGIELPNSVMHPNPDDKIILTGWNIEALDEGGLIEQAEYELLNEAEKLARRIAIDPHTYNIVLMSDFVRSNIIEKLPSRLGRMIDLRNAYLFDSGRRTLRVVGYDVKLDIPYDSPMIIAGEKLAKSNIKDAKSGLTAIRISRISAIPFVSKK